VAAIITNLRSLNDAGVLASRKAATPSLAFRKLNLIYGFNGSGKSTLSRIFASLENGALDPKLPAGCSFEMTLDEGTTLGCPANPNGLERRLLVFNGDFQDKNLQWHAGRASPVFFIGEEQAEAAAELAAKELQLPALRREVVQKEAADTAAEKSLTKFKREQARAIAPRLHLGSRKYEAPHLLEDYTQWPKEELSLLSDSELAAAEDIRRQAAPMAAVRSPAFDADRIKRAQSFVTEICGQSLGQVSLDELKKYPEMLLGA